VRRDELTKKLACRLRRKYNRIIHILQILS